MNRTVAAGVLFVTTLTLLAWAAWPVSNSQTPADYLLPALIGFEAVTVVEECEGTSRGRWVSSFDLAMRDGSVWVTLRVRLIPAEGVSKNALFNVTRQWESDIESILDDKFVLALPKRAPIPLRFDIAFKGLNTHHEVIVRPGIGHTDELNWNLLNSSHVIVHEVGHMLGAYDEYPKGKLDLTSKRVDPSSVMAGEEGGSLVYPRYFQLVLDQLKQQLKLNNAQILAKSQ